MGLFSFVKNIGRMITGDPAEDIREVLNEELAGQIDNLVVEENDGKIRLLGQAKTEAVREKAILLAGNVKGVETVDGYYMTVAAVPPPPPVFYTIKSGDSLSKIAKEVYGDAMKWNALFQANLEVIKDPDLIYPGQQIRIPQDL